MILSNKEIDTIRALLANIEKADRVTVRKYYLTNQVETSALSLARLRDGKNTLCYDKRFHNG